MTFFNEIHYYSGLFSSFLYFPCSGSVHSSKLEGQCHHLFIQPTAPRNWCMVCIYWMLCIKKRESKNKREKQDKSRFDDDRIHKMILVSITPFYYHLKRLHRCAANHCQPYVLFTNQRCGKLPLVTCFHGFIRYFLFT